MLVLGPDSIYVRQEPTTTSPRITTLSPGTSMNVIERQRQLGDPAGPVWYKVRLEIGTSLIEGWVRADTVSELDNCNAVPLP